MLKQYSVHKSRCFNEIKTTKYSVGFVVSFPGSFYRLTSEKVQVDVPST